MTGFMKGSLHFWVQEPILRCQIGTIRLEGTFRGSKSYEEYDKSHSLCFIRHGGAIDYVAKSWHTGGIDMAPPEAPIMTASPDIFSTVAKKDYVNLFDGDKPKCQDVMEFIGFKKQDVARAVGVPLASVRWDERIPAEVSDRFREWANLINLVAQFFDGDVQKTGLWFTLPNPMLGNVSPRDMIRFGRYKRLAKFIATALSENRR